MPTQDPVISVAVDPSLDWSHVSFVGPQNMCVVTVVSHYACS